VKNTGVYPVAADEPAVHANLPGGVYPTNPFTGTANEAPESWAAAASAQGRYATNSTTTTYVITGFGKTAALSLVLTNG
jgi:hypothetical protein